MFLMTRRAQRRTALEQTRGDGHCGAIKSTQGQGAQLPRGKDIHMPKEETARY